MEKVTCRNAVEAKFTFSLKELESPWPRSSGAYWSDQAFEAEDGEEKYLLLFPDVVGQLLRPEQERNGLAVRLY